MNKLSLLLLVVCVGSFVAAKTCKYNYQCSGKNVCVGGANACSGSRGLAVNDNQYYNTISYSSTCKAKGASTNFTLLRLNSVNGSEPNTLYTHASGARMTTLAELFNGVYLDSFSGNTHTLVSYSPSSKQISPVALQPNFQGYLEIDGQPSLAYSCAYDTSSSKYILNTYGGLEEGVLFTTPEKTLYVYPAGSTCGPSRLGTDDTIYLVSYVNNTSLFSVGRINCTYCPATTSKPTSTPAVTGTPTPSSVTSTSRATGTPRSTSTPTPSPSPCTTCTVPAPFYSVAGRITDFDVSGSYIFYGTSMGLFRYTLGSGAIMKVYNGAITGVDAGGQETPGVGSSFIYFNTGTSIDKLPVNGSGLKMLNFAKTGYCGVY